MLAGDVLALGADGEVSRRHVGEVAAALRPRAGGGAVIAIERGFSLEAPDGSLAPLPELWRDAGIRMNDGGCDPEGRFYAGSMALDRRPGAGALYRLDPDGTVEKVHDGVTISNGLDWSPDGSRAYYVDTETQRVWVLDWGDAPDWKQLRPFIEIPPDTGRPDGLTVDAEGCVWVALSVGGAVHRYRPDGRLDGVVDVPARKVTACAFGGEALDRLFITTSREDLRPGEDPLAGALFAADVGVPGRPVREFAG